MFSVKALKFFFFSSFASLIFSACGFWQTGSGANANSNPFAAEELKNEIPFENKEPEIFQAEIVLTSYLNGEKIERVIKAARSGDKFRYDYPNGTSFLQTGENESFLLEKNRKIYAQSSINSAGSAQAGESLKDFLTTEWLNEKRGAKFESLGTENNLAKYRVSGENLNSEIIIYVDERLKFPVKQEFYSVSGGEKTLLSAVEIKNLKLEADESIFQIPKDYKKISAGEFQKTLGEKISDANQ